MQGNSLMRTPLILTVLAMIVSSQFARADDDPFAPAKVGKLECFAPDSEKKTCLDMTRYTWEANNQILEEDEFAFSANPLITARSKDFVVINRCEACQVVSKDKVLEATFFRDGVQVSDSEQTQFRERHLQQLNSIVGKKVCMSLSPYGGVFIAEYSIDGNPLPAATNRLKWISPDEGYVLAP
jgi:hypothetical protein